MDSNWENIYSFHVGRLGALCSRRNDVRYRLIRWDTGCQTAVVMHILVYEQLGCYYKNHDTLWS
jgi:hypothetical protein